MAEPVLVRKKPLSLDEVVAILQSETISKDCQPLAQPKGYQAFVFSAEDEPMNKND